MQNKHPDVIYLPCDQDILDQIKNQPVRSTKTKTLQDYPVSYYVALAIISGFVECGDIHDDWNEDFEVVKVISKSPEFTRTDFESATFYNVDEKFYKIAKNALKDLGYITVTIGKAKATTSNDKTKFVSTGSTYKPTYKILNLTYSEANLGYSSFCAESPTDKVKTVKKKKKVTQSLDFKKLSIIPSEYFMKKLNRLPYTSKKKVTKSFGKQLDKVRFRIFEILNELFAKSIQLHFIERNKRPHLAYPFFSKEQATELVGDNWSIVRTFLKDARIIQPYIDKSKNTESYASGFDEEGNDLAIDPYPKRWRINPRYFSTKYFDFVPIIGKSTDSVTLHPSIDDKFTQISKLRKWNTAIEFIMKHQVHVFNYKDIQDVTVSKYGRVFNKVNILPRQIREFVLIDGIETETLDYSSCSLTILYSKISRINDEQASWLRMLQHPNGAYQYIADATNYTKEEIKDDVVRWIGCRGKDQKWKSFIMNEFLSKHFPITYSDLEQGKVDLVGYTQNIESKIIVKALADKGISIHDAIIVKHYDTEEVHELMGQIMGHFTSARDVESFDELELMLSDNHLNGVTGEPKLEEKVIRNNTNI